jgi:hypothetical protein
MALACLIAAACSFKQFWRRHKTGQNGRIRYLILLLLAGALGALSISRMLGGINGKHAGETSFPGESLSYAVEKSTGAGAWSIGSSTGQTGIKRETGRSWFDKIRD